MRSRSLAVLAAVAFAASPAAAQTPVTFTLVGNPPAYAPQPTVWFSGSTYYSSPYLGSFNGGTTSFLVWCVDYNHSVSFGDTYTAELTPLLGDLSLYTRRGTAGLNGYEWAAYYAGMISPSNANNVNYQLAMWDAVSQGGFALSETSGIGAALGALGKSTTFYLSSSPLLDPENWALIDGTGNGVNKQEFLVYSEGIGRTTEVVPEPVTMSLLATGLAGMAIASRKRRRNTAA
jgi:hypothetical protein